MPLRMTSPGSCSIDDECRPRILAVSPVVLPALELRGGVGTDGEILNTSRRAAIRGRISSPGGGTANDWNLTYDSWGNTKSAAHEPTGTDVSYTLDALDRVLSRTAGGTSTSYTYQGTGEDVARSQVGAATPVHYDFTPSGPLAQRTGTDATTLRYYLRDVHGDVVATAATSGTNRVGGSILYSPWGEPGARTGEMSTSPTQGYLGFQGGLTDAATGQVDMLTRYYEPTLGRFTKRDVLFGDPGIPMSLNQFVYGQMNPVSFADPTGMVISACATECSSVTQQRTAAHVLLRLSLPGSLCSL